MEESKNIFSNIPESLPDEFFEDIISTENFRIERIISRGHKTPKDKWYDQDKNEWVMVLKGNAELLFEEGNKIIKMKEGDYINIPTHVKHRVEKTDSGEETVWLAIHY